MRSRSATSPAVMTSSQVSCWTRRASCTGVYAIVRRNRLHGGVARHPAPALRRAVATPPGAARRPPRRGLHIGECKSVCAGFGVSEPCRCSWTEIAPDLSGELIVLVLLWVAGLLLGAGSCCFVPSSTRTRLVLGGALEAARQEFWEAVGRGRARRAEVVYRSGPHGSLGGLTSETSCFHSETRARPSRLAQLAQRDIALRLAGVARCPCGRNRSRCIGVRRGRR